MATGDTRWFCFRCKRALENDTKRDGRYHDTVTPRSLAEPPRFVHDQCGGDVALSVREARA